MNLLNIGTKRAVSTLFALSLIVAPLCMKASAAGAEGKIQTVSTQTAAPDFQLPDLDGTTVDFAKIKGQKPVLLYFWASWCPYCMAVRPKVVELRNTVPKNDLEILGINVGGGDSIEKVKRYQQAHPTPFTVLYDADGKVSHQYQVQGIPLFVLFDKSGAVKYRGNDMPADVVSLLK